VTAAFVVVGLAIQLLVSATSTEGHFTSPAARVVNVFFFFTIDSNIIVGATTLLLAIRLRRPSPVFRSFRLAGIVGIAVTGIVYHTVLTGLHELHGWALVADLILHTCVPILAVVSWLVFGPPARTSWSEAGWALVFPLIWLVVTLVRGRIVDWYPYPFVDVIKLGYGRVTLNCLGVAVAFLVITALAVAHDRWLARRQARLGKP
jgi:hypothetical protein